MHAPRLRRPKHSKCSVSSFKVRTLRTSLVGHSFLPTAFSSPMVHGNFCRTTFLRVVSVVAPQTYGRFSLGLGWPANAILFLPNVKGNQRHCEKRRHQRGNSFEHCTLNKLNLISLPPHRTFIARSRYRWRLAGKNGFSGMGPVRIRHSSHDLGWQPSHSVDLAGWQAKMASIEIWIPWRNAHKPHSAVKTLKEMALAGHPRPCETCL